jgi:FMN phosphatase YigB (HAD superfamily)
MKEKVILVDADGVLLDWEYSFGVWMNSIGYELIDENAYKIHERFSGLDYELSKRLVRFFNESANVRYLPPHRDAIKYVRELHESYGYIFHCITSLSLNPYAQKLREQNLRELFGPTTFDRILCLDTGADKDEALEEYKDTGCFWVEDKPENAEVGSQLGLDSILMAHGHNADYSGQIRRVQNWKEIATLIIGE